MGSMYKKKVIKIKRLLILLYFIRRVYITLHANLQTVGSVHLMDELNRTFIFIDPGMFLKTMVFILY